MNIITAYNPRLTEAGDIDLVVVFEEIGEPIPFTASVYDSEPHGRDLYNRAAASEFGPVAPYVPPVPTQEATLNAMTSAIQEHLDNKARERRYDGILSLCTYATSTNPKFAAEGQAGVNWRDAVWATAYTIMDEVLGGNREVPSVEELLAELPVFKWPDEL
jgi:hypothetical protein